VTPTVLLECEWVLRSGYPAGLDLADARHLALSGPVTQFASFERKLVKNAGALQARTLRLP
tara:strand:- start:2176 stop:2358 length:183 start_codon:yes stop_codon:yes gene_type:complete